MRSIFIKIITIWLLSTGFGFAQGSITGQVNNIDMTVPPDPALSFFGFLDNTDEEIKIELCDGSGYESGHWFDDFQNYMTEAPGNPYDYFFFDSVKNEGYHLEEVIPNNSFQVEDVPLEIVAWPAKPIEFYGSYLSPTSIQLEWAPQTDVTFHVYRRVASSNGSFFRIDNPSGSLGDPGIADHIYTDNSVTEGVTYQYVVIGEDASGHYSPHSRILTPLDVTQQVTIDHIDNAAPTDGLLGFPDTIAAGKDVTFYFRFTNITDNVNCGYSINYNMKVYSPDGASFGIPTLDTVNIGKDEFSSIIFDCFGCDGIGIDSLVFAGITFTDPGLYEGYNDIALSLTITTSLADTGKMICLDTIPIVADSTYYLSGYKWKWSGTSACEPLRYVKPDWYESPLCFYIADLPETGCCKGFTGNTDCSEDEAPDISDIVRIIDFLYLSHDPLCCLEEADADASGGDPDISDIVKIIDHLYLSHKPLPACP